ncbi:MAG: hypothetical protein HGA47_05065, partial [Zoogloea sp.]|nr:hypothetical protein [Zoogloea sp.]
NGMRAGAQPGQLAGVAAPAAQVASAAPAAAADAAGRGGQAAEAPASEREYLFAHQALSPASPIPGVALYVRTVSDHSPNGSR